MRIIEAQNAALTNFEVTDFLQQRHVRLSKENRKGPPSKEVENLLKAVSTLLTKDPSPLSQVPTKYSPEAIRTLISRLKPYELTKAEMIMIINIRPQTQSALHCCIEEIEERLKTEDKQLAILGIVAEVLGNFEPKPVDGDEDMQDDLPPDDMNGTS